MDKYRNGDVVSWMYKSYDNGWDAMNIYHTKDCQAVYWDGLFYDTYWASYQDPKNHIFCKDSLRSCTWVSEQSITIRHICNVFDIRRISEEESKYRKDAVYNLSHQKGHHKLFAVDKDTQRSYNVVRDLLKEEIDKTNAERQYLYNRWNRLLNMLVDLEMGKITAEDVRI